MRFFSWPILVTVVVATNVGAATITVSQDGQGDHTNVQGALDAASNGDEIVILDSAVYEEDVTAGEAAGLVASFTLRAAQGQSPVIRAAHEINRAADYGVQGSDMFGAMFFGCQGVVIEGITFENPAVESNTTGIASALSLFDCSKFTVRNCTIRGAGGVGTAYQSNPAGIFIAGVATAPVDILVEDCLIEESHIGVTIAKSVPDTPTDPSVTLRRCTIQHCNNSAVDSDNGAPPNNQDPTIATGQGNLFEDCLFVDCSGAFDAGGGYSVLRNCTILSARGEGIQIDYDGPHGTRPLTVIVENTAVIGSDGAGIRINEGNVQINHSIIAGSGEDGLYLRDVGLESLVTVDHCDFYENSTVEATFDVRVDPTTSALLQLRISNSNIVGPWGLYNGDLNDETYFDPESFFADFCNVFGSDPPYTNVVFTNDREFDPLYVSPTGDPEAFTREGFQLSANSPVLNLASDGGFIGSQGPEKTGLEDWTVY